MKNFKSFLSLSSEVELNRSISEGLIRSSSRKELVHFLSKYKSNLIVKTGKPGRYDALIVRVRMQYDAQLFAKVEQILKICGWYVAIYFLDFKSAKHFEGLDVQNGDDFQLDLEPKYDTLYDQLPKIVYHAFPLAYQDKIERIGLIPRSNSRLSTHPERVYVATNLESIKSITRRFMELDKVNYGIFKIDTSKLIYGTQFYWDMNFMGDDEPQGLYTLHNIPPEALTFFKAVTI